MKRSLYCQGKENEREIQFFDKKIVKKDGVLFYFATKNLMKKLGLENELDRIQVIINFHMNKKSKNEKKRRKRTVQIQVGHFYLCFIVHLTLRRLIFHDGFTV